MELRVLQYFLAVAREESISGAAKALHLSQPTLSRQLKELEDHFGKQLFTRGSRKITLTEEGHILRKRAEEIFSLVEKTENEITLNAEIIAGDVYIGAGETDSIRYLTRAARELRQQHPQVHFHIASGDTVDVVEQLDRGLIDFGLVFDPVDLSKYDSLRLPYVDTWGVLMKKDAPLSEKESISPEDLWDKPLIISRQAMQSGHLSSWLKREESQLNIIATYNLVFNASRMVTEDMGYALTFDKLINVTGDSPLCFRPLNPVLNAHMNIIWKKYQVFPKAAKEFLHYLKKL